MYSKKRVKKAQKLPENMERAIRDYNDKKKNIKDKIFEGEEKPKKKYNKQSYNGKKKK